jgi:PAS domain S-box-containing protein
MNLITIKEIFDLLISICYFIIPFLLFYFYKILKISLDFSKKEDGKKLVRNFVYSGNAFIFSCALTHLSSFVFKGNETYVIKIKLCLTIFTFIASLTAALLLLFKGPVLIQILGEIEINTLGRTQELKDAFEISSNWSADMISIHSLIDLKFLYVNVLCNMFGYTSETLLNNTLTQLVHDGDHYIITELLQENKERSSLIREFRLKSSNGLYIYIESSCKFGYYKGNRVVFLISRNIEHRVESFNAEMLLQSESVRIETAKTQVLSIIHDLRTPLSIFELSLNVDPINIEACKQSLNYMKLVIDRTVQSCFVLQGKKPIPKITKINIIETVNNVLKQLDSYPKTVQITSLIEIDSSRDFFCDNDWIISILFNMLTNACDNTIFGNINIHIYDKSNYINFNISDTGSGILEENKSKLFKPFTKLLDKYDDEPMHGIGLGLYNCAWRIKLLFGTYDVLPNPLAEQGTVFVFSLPINYNKHLLDQLKSSSKDLSTVINKINFSKTQILIADDSIVFRKLLATQLKKSGYINVDESKDGKETIKMLINKKYDFAFIDLWMPFYKGDECIRQYREHEKKNTEKRTICIIVSADILNIDHQLIKNGSIDRYISKPVQFQVIQDIIKEFDYIESNS